MAVTLPQAPAAWHETLNQFRFDVVQRLGRCTNIKPESVKRLVFARSLAVLVQLSYTVQLLYKSVHQETHVHEDKTDADPLVESEAGCGEEDERQHEDEEEDEAELGVGDHTHVSCMIVHL